MKDLKYLLAFLPPMTVIPGLLWQGAWSWFAVCFVFGLVPLLELISPQSTENVPPEQEESRSERLFFDLLLYANALILFGICWWYLNLIASKNLVWHDWLGISIGTGIIVGACGINVAHELGHRNNMWEQKLAILMLLPALYQHFFIEHNRGHHKHVATDKDPASARKGDWLFSFWVRSISGSWLNAWALEHERLNRSGQNSWNFQNLMLRFLLYQTGWLTGIYMFFGGFALFSALIIALVGVLLLETVNYIEHYGLRRALLPSGHYEAVSPAHSWNSNHEIGRILLYELTRHSDHHYKANRKYQVLRHIDVSPQLPFGYPTCILLALCPPLWFSVMNPRLNHS